MLAALGLLLAFAFQSPYVAYFMYAFLLLVALANVTTRLWLTGIEVHRKISGDVLMQGDTLEVEVEVRNSRGWPVPWMFIEDFYPKDFPRSGDCTHLAVLMPGRSVQISYRLLCPRRGYHRIGPLLLETGDLFGLQKRFKTGTAQDYISVLPTIAYIDTFNISARRPQGPVRISNRIYEDPTRISGVREYAPGDPLNRIHWKLSARTGELFTKTVDPSTVTGATLVLDLHADSYFPERAESRQELAITTTASIAYLLQMSGEQVGMITNARDAAEVAQWEVAAQQSLTRTEADASVVGEAESTRLRPLQVPTRRSSVQALQIAESLARVLPGESMDVEELIRNEFQRLPRHASLLPVVPGVTERLATFLAEMKFSGFAVSVFLIDDQAGYREAASLLAPHNINVFHIRHQRDLHEISPAQIGR
jgi:uncharacterized protein (DUF58 family)